MIEEVFEKLLHSLDQHGQEEMGGGWEAPSLGAWKTSERRTIT